MLFRYALLLGVLLCALAPPAGAVSATRALAPLPSRIVSAPTLRIRADTVPPLTPQERRELRRLEREVAQMKRALGEGGGFASDRPDRRARGKGRNPLAVPSFVLGVAAVGFFFLGISSWTVLFIDLWFTLCIVSFAAALVFGIISVRRAKRRGGGKRGLALAGMILGIIGGAFWLTVLTALLANGFL